MTLNLTVIVQGGGVALKIRPGSSRGNCEPEATVDVALDSAKIEPSVRPDALARFCACVVALEIKPEIEQVCDCANCCETCVPTILNDSIIPLFSLVMFCCTVVRVATVALVFVSGTGRLNVHPIVGTGGGRRTGAKDCDGLTLRIHTSEVRRRNSRSLQRCKHVVKTAGDARYDSHRENRLIGLKIGVIGNANRDRIRVQLSESEGTK